MTPETRLIAGPFGPHAGKLEVRYAGKWHFVKWVSLERLNKPQEASHMRALPKRGSRTKKNKTPKK